MYLAVWDGVVGLDAGHIVPAQKSGVDLPLSPTQRDRPGMASFGLVRIIYQGNQADGGIKPAGDARADRRKYQGRQPSRDRTTITGRRVTDHQRPGWSDAQLLAASQEQPSVGLHRAVLI